MLNTPVKNAITVSELNREVKSLLENAIAIRCVEGEISNLARPSSGHWYFTLKDNRAQVRCAMFRNRTQYLKFIPKEGDLVRVVARVSLYEGRGDYQLICDQLAQGGTGQLQQAFEALKARLDHEGLFSSEHKKTLPRHPRQLGVITSPTGAAIHDILQVLDRRYAALPVIVYPTAVQGKEAAAQIARAIELANQHNACDVLIVGRGGGSLEDLWPFNEEIVARAIFNSEIPIVSAVGHEVDITISDLVADLRAPTPSAAAELLSPNQAELRQRLRQASLRLHQQQLGLIRQQRNKLLALRQRLRHPGDRLRDQAQRLDSLETRLTRALQRRLKQAGQQLEVLQKRQQRLAPGPRVMLLQSQLEQLHKRLHKQIDNQLSRKRQLLQHQIIMLNSISPLATLERGYAIAQGATGQVILDAAEVKAGDRMTVRVHHGWIDSEVKSTHD
ncbi:exodeoxyribonuclease VII large subunit [Nitrincola sp. MINF-07-Sa-05]|uniref:exodeoxyribonuclease VII large subunit n=1 Tax=Nitrincola salilacus TaxID=3400273 RepID=UPI0039185590